MELLNKEKDLQTGVTGVLCAVCCLLSWRYPPFYVVNTNKINHTGLRNVNKYPRNCRNKFFPLKSTIYNFKHLSFGEVGKKYCRFLVNNVS